MDHRLDSFLTAGEGVEFCLRKNESLIGPAGRHDFANEGDIEIAMRRHGGIWVPVHPLLDRVDEIEVAVHLLVFDQGSAENNLRNEHDRYNENASLAFRYESGDEQAYRRTACSSKEHRDENNPEPIPKREEGIPDPSEKCALDECKEGESQNFGENIEAQVHIEISLPHEHGSIVNDVVHAVRQS